MRRICNFEHWYLAPQYVGVDIIFSQASSSILRVVSNMTVIFVYPTIVAVMCLLLFKVTGRKKIQCAIRVFTVEDESAERVKICNVKALTLRHNKAEEVEEPI